MRLRFAGLFPAFHQVMSSRSKKHDFACSAKANPVLEQAEAPGLCDGAYSNANIVSCL